MTLDARIGEVTERIRRRSESGRSQYLEQIAIRRSVYPSTLSLRVVHARTSVLAHRP